MRKSIVCLFVVFTLTLMASMASTASAKAIKLKATTFVPSNIAGGVWATEFFKRVNEKSNGQIEIKYLGGPEVMPEKDQYKAVMDGVVDMCISPMTWYSSEMPAALVAGISGKTPMEEREPGGLYDLFVESHESIGLRYLGRVNGNVTSHIGLNVKVEKPEDFKSLKIRTSKVYNSFFKSMKIAGVNTKSSEIYTSMERGVVEGFVLTWESVPFYKLEEVTKYWLDVPLFPAGTQVLIMNQKKWDSLPDDMKKLMTDIMANEIEPELYENFGKKYVEAIAVSKKAGLEPLAFSAEDAKSFQDAAIDAKWQEIKKVLPADDFMKFKAAATK